jgi:hypothetical protein
VQRKLISRIELLEARLIPKQVDPWVFISHPITEERRRNLEPGERVVLDYFRQNGFLIDAAERITTDPKDQGRRCEPGGYLESVIRELHEDCDYRGRDGGCHTCADTPVANT